MQNHSPCEPWALATVLLVQHDVSDAEELAESLHEEPYQVYVVTSVPEAMRVVAAQSIDVVLADQQLDGVHDGEFFRVLEQSQPSIIRILLGHRKDPSSSGRLARLGRAHRWIPQPCDHGELATTLFNALVQRSFLPPESEHALPVPVLIGK